MDTEIFTRIIGVLLFLTAGICTYLFIINRLLCFCRDANIKRLYIVSLFLILTFGSSIPGYITGFSWLLIIPISVLGIVLIGEMRRVFIRKKLRGSSPVEITNGRFSGKHLITTTDLAIYRYNIHFPDKKGFNFRVAHISDLHLTDQLSYNYFKSVSKRLNETNPDIVFITGDFITKAKFASYIPDILGNIRPRLGIYAILGNHDYWGGADEVINAVRSTGVKLLYNGSQRIHIENQGDLLICGCEDPWGKKRWQVPQINSNDFVLVLSHTPDNIYKLSAAGANAVFSGHYHGGQILIPPFGSMVIPSIYGRRFDHGHFVVNKTHLFVTSGIGAATPTLRVCCQPDIFIVDFKG